ncbi:hypothetical protein ElyMa_001663300 [Elysia marginata]|uniref:Galectin domain-containing protein n=1 Tax=Elysia marginata TaxID=1093978 RepID=A0AAV4JSE2_9GAST|nr:hypothetical protein ElyMa_001663300 [Elysia marginata]
MNPLRQFLLLRKHQAARYSPPLLLLLLLLVHLSETQAETCSPVPMHFSYHTGMAPVSVCSSGHGNAMTASLRCAARPECKIVRLLNCVNDNCTYYICDRLGRVDFSNTGLWFYLKLELIDSYTRSVYLKGGLVAGQPLLITFRVIYPYTHFNFKASNGDVALRVHFYFNWYRTSFDSIINGTPTTKADSTARFTFKHLQVISIFCVVTSARYILYFDEVLFLEYDHLIPVEDVTYFETFTRNALVYSFHR